MCLTCCLSVSVTYVVWRKNKRNHKCEIEFYGIAMTIALTAFCGNVLKKYVASGLRELISCYSAQWVTRLYIQKYVAKSANNFPYSHPSMPGTRLEKPQEGADSVGRSPFLKPTKVTLFTVILHISENSIRDIRQFWRPLFFHSSVVKYTSSLLQ